jgi:hypothetical protein
MYTKLFQSILTSTIWGEDHATLRVWITLLAMADKNGEVIATIPGLARVACVTIQEVEHALEKFQSPDKYSRTPDDEGRRIEQNEDGWVLINYEKYRKMASKEDQKAKNAERVRKFRERQKRNGKSLQCNTKSESGNDKVTQGRDIAEAEAEAEAEEYSLSEERGAPSASEREIPASQTDFAEIPTLEEVIAEAEMRGIPDEHARSFWEYTEGKQLWINQYGKMTKWKMNLKSWSDRRRTIPPNGKQSTGYKKIEI